MKKFICLLSLIFLASCSSSKKTITSEPLFKIIKSSQEEGGTFSFFETVTEKNEFSMLLNDPDLKDILLPNDIATSNFALINLGAKPDSGYSIKVTLVSETADKIVLKITENKPAVDNDEGSNPLFILKISSKKILELQ